jgi:predicted ATPase
MLSRRKPSASKAIFCWHKRLWAERGERGRAGNLLAPVYNWFTEGFDTADLQEARALLDALAS